MLVASTDLRDLLPIFEDAQKVLKVAGTLCRLVRLDKHLARGTTRHETVQKLHAIWKRGLDLLTTSQDAHAAKMEIKNQLAKLLDEVHPLARKRIVAINEIFDNELKLFEPAERLENSISRFLKDLRSLQISPLAKSHQGLNGPTYLVSYPRFNAEVGNSNLHNYVVKWVECKEVYSSRVYEAFAGCMAQSFRSVVYSVPVSAALDFNLCMHEIIDGSRVALPAALTKALENKFNEILQVVSPGLQPSGKAVMLMERVAGANLYDFAQSKYCSLAVWQKEWLFAHLGQLALLDLLIGNQDRFIRIPEHGPHQEFLESNLGNAMVVWSGKDNDPPKLVAIDNDVQESLMAGGQSAVLYQACLENLFKAPNMVEILAKGMLLSVLKGLDRMVEDEDNPLKVKKQLAAFVEELPAIALPAFEKGLQAMSDAIAGLSIPLEENCAFTPLKNYLLAVQPDWIEVLSMRVAMFQSFRRRQ